MHGNMHNKALLQIIIIKALEHTIATSSILLFTSISILYRRHFFKQAVSKLQSLNNPDCPVTPLQNQLNLFLDTAGAVRCQGHTRIAKVPNSSKTPILLPSHSHFTEPLILHRHMQVLHNGIGETVNVI